MMADKSLAGTAFDAPITRSTSAAHIHRTWTLPRPVLKQDSAVIREIGDVAFSAQQIYMLTTSGVVTVNAWGAPEGESPAVVES